MHDTITIDTSLSNEIQFRTNDLTIPTDSRNTVVKALEELGVNQSDALRVYLNKVIPHEAGLGGGSANAATILNEVNDFLKLAYDSQDLIKMAEKIGSDVPFFLHGGVCDVAGRGEIITKKNIKLPYKIVIIKPKNIAFSTALIYKNYKDYLTEDVNTDALSAFYENPSKETIRNLENHLERAIPEKKLIQDLKHLHYDHGAFYSAMSGSGSSVFGLYEEKTELPKRKDYQIFTAEFIHR